MILDKQLIFSNGQALTATADSTNVIDLGQTRANEGEPTEILLQVDTALTSGGASTLVVSLVTDDNEAFSSATTLLSTPAIPKATLVRGYQFSIGYLPPNVERYVKLVYTVGTADFTAGNINAALVLARQTNV